MIPSLRGIQYLVQRVMLIKIILGMFFGVVFGLMASYFNWTEFTRFWIKPWGIIFVNLLKLIALPLVFASLVKGVASLSSISSLSKIGGKTVIFYLLSTVISVVIGLSLVNIISPGKVFSEEKRIELQQTYSNNTNSKILAAEDVQENGPLQFLVDIVPSNIFKSFTSPSPCFGILKLILFPFFHTAGIIK